MESKTLYLATYPNVAFTHSGDSRKKAVPFAHKELKKSLEAIVSESDPGPRRPVLEDMFTDKARTLKASVNALLEEIQLRQDLNTSHFNKMNDEICRQHTELMQLDNIRDSYPFDLTRDLDEAKARIKSNVLELEREKRQEGLECWRDLMFLKKYLMRSLKDYWELARRRNALSPSKLTSSITS
ncbi:MAG: hypothetical protein AMJ60_07555 [Desulfobacterales bacterium SG8_35]|nr:MAG: hypothetical protein AMJ60_07555 [Desulfobacterales bacterium SG8_35]